MKTIKNYHPTSMKYEDKYTKDLLEYFGFLLLDLNNIKDLTKGKINETIAAWKDKYQDELEEVNRIHVLKLDKFSDKTIPTDETKREQTTLVNQLTNANMDMLNVNVDFLRQKFVELKTLENTYNYSKSMSDEFVRQVASSLEDKIVLFATMSTIGNLRELLFGNAESQGYTEYLWITQRDSKVRPSHAAMDGKWIKFDAVNPQPAGYHVGMDYNCRCFIGAVR